MKFDDLPYCTANFVCCGLSVLCVKSVLLQTEVDNMKPCILEGIGKRKPFRGSPEIRIGKIQWLLASLMFMLRIAFILQQIRVTLFWLQFSIWLALFYWTSPNQAVVAKLPFILSCFFRTSILSKATYFNLTASIYIVSLSVRHVLFVPPSPWN